MRKLLVLVPAMLALLGVPALAAELDPRNNTVFHHAERSFAVGVVRLAKPQQFREGKILAFPATITELVWAPKETKPRNLMLIHQVASDETDQPFFKEDDVFFGPIRLLPEHSYWRDNLPTTRRHEVAGGRRNAFRGDDIEPVKKLLAEYLAADDKPAGHERWKAKLRVVSSALGSRAPVVREDAVRYLATYPSLARDFEEQSLQAVLGYLGGDAPPVEKATLVDALAAANVTGLEATLEKLRDRDDATGAAALRGLETLGEKPATDQVLSLSKSSSEDMRAYAAGSLGRRAATDEEARKRAFEILGDDKETIAVKRMAAAGLGDAGGEPVVEGLAGVVRGAGPSAGVAADALAEIGGPAATGALAKILTQSTGEAARIAVAGLKGIEECADCHRVLVEQYRSHPDEEVRHLIGVALGIPTKHEH